MKLTKLCNYRSKSSINISCKLCTNKFCKLKGINNETK
jgi:hypothetical protein